MRYIIYLLLKLCKIVNSVRYILAILCAPKKSYIHEKYYLAKIQCSSVYEGLESIYFYHYHYCGCRKDFQVCSWLATLEVIGLYCVLRQSAKFNWKILLCNFAACRHELFLFPTSNKNDFIHLSLKYQIGR